MKTTLVLANIAFLMVDFGLLFAAAAVPFLRCLQVAVLDGALFPPLIEITLSPVVGECVLILRNVALIGPDILVIMAKFAIVATDARAFPARSQQKPFR